MVAVARWQAELAEDARDVLLDCALGHDQALGHRLVGPALGDQREHVALTRGQLLQPSGPAPCDQLRDDLGVHRGAAGRDAPHGLDEFRGSATRSLSR